MLLVFEGIDGAGKDTLIDMLEHKLRAVYGSKIISMRPSLSPENKDYITNVLIQSGSQDLDSHNIIADLFLRNMIELSANIQDLIQRGYCILLNRWYYSTLAYNGVNSDTFDSIYMKIVNNIHNNAILVPDGVVYIDIDPEVAMQRIAERGNAIEVWEDVSTLRKARERYIGIFNNPLFEDILPQEGVMMVYSNEDPVKITNDLLDDLYETYGI